MWVSGSTRVACMRERGCERAVFVCVCVCVCVCADLLGDTLRELVSVGLSEACGLAECAEAGASFSDTALFLRASADLVLGWPSLFCELLAPLSAEKKRDLISGFASGVKGSSGGVCVT